MPVRISLVAESPPQNVALSGLGGRGGRRSWSATLGYRLSKWFGPCGSGGMQRRLEIPTGSVASDPD